MKVSGKLKVCVCWLVHRTYCACAQLHRDDLDIIFLSVPDWAYLDNGFSTIALQFYACGLPTSFILEILDISVGFSYEFNRLTEISRAVVALWMMKDLPYSQRWSSKLVLKRTYRVFCWAYCEKGKFLDASGFGKIGW